MKCVIPGANVKVFGKAVHSLSKIGDEIYIEPLEQGLALRTVNSSRSAYACFVFAQNFFTHYNSGAATADLQCEEQMVKCKIGMKSCLTVFKSLATLEKTVDKCKVTLDMETARLIFQLYCRHGIVKTHNLAFVECETLQAIFSKEFCPNVLKAQARLLADVVVNFQTTQEEVSIILDSQRVTFKNYTDDEPDASKVVHTQLSLESQEFEEFQVGVDTEVTFCLKELRAILAFSETANLPVAIHFEGAGKPIVFSLDSDPTFEANFVLATLAEPGYGATQTSQLSTQRSEQYRPMSSTTGRLQKKVSSNKAQAATTPGLVRNGRTSHTEAPTRGKGKVSASERMNKVYQELLSEDVELHNQDAAEKSTEQTAPKPDHKLETGNLEPMSLGTSFLADSDVSAEDEEDTLVPGTPPSKKFKSSFFGISQSASGSQQAEDGPRPAILAEDTDDDDDH